MESMIRDLCLAVAVDVVAHIDKSKLTRGEYEGRQKTVYGEWDIEIEYDRAEGVVEISARPLNAPRELGHNWMGQRIMEGDPNYEGPMGFSYCLPASWLPKPEEYAYEMLERAKKAEE
jgi:hypothetical protein